MELRLLQAGSVARRQHVAINGMRHAGVWRGAAIQP